MKVILTKDVAKLGQRGTVIEVADGYAVNVLIPKGMGIQGTPAELAKWKQKEDSKKHKKDLETNTFLQLVDKIQNTKIEIAGKKHDNKGQLFAAIHETDIAEAIYNAIKLSVDPKQVITKNSIKTIGEHTVTLKQGTQSANITIEVK